jgi:malto-oligosyltrehalose trehalohydrolase
MKRKHRMPFGAECREDGSVRFRLWAPKAQRVSVSLENKQSGSLSMAKLDGGWFELIVGDAAPGDRYKYLIDDATEVPDPASRFQPADVYGPSEIVDPNAFDWSDENWQGRDWEDAVIYELHVGAFSPAGTFAGAAEKLDYLADIGVTAVELMPVSDFPGKRNWGYDGVLPYAPDGSYGRPEDLKRLIQSAHEKGLMIFLDVVYNHFGPDGNYLREYAPQFFTDRHRIPWGEAINFDGGDSRTVRDFFIHNALYWLEEYHFDGLRLDAVHAILDDSRPDILVELAETVRETFGPDRHVHLILENGDNAARYLRRGRDGNTPLYNAQWNDDFHHVLHVMLTGETDGYYSDYVAEPIKYLGRCLAEGFAFQGDFSKYHAAKRGESSADLSPVCFVNFLQNHDQIGNRAFGERITKLTTEYALKAGLAILLLAPSPPLLFMGEEFGDNTPFLFFCDFAGDLATAVTDGRRNEFSRFEKFYSDAVRAQIPDPNSESTFERSKLDWQTVNEQIHTNWLDFYRELLSIRRDAIIPHLKLGTGDRAKYNVAGKGSLAVNWTFGDNSSLTLLANLGSEPGAGIPRPPGDVIYTNVPEASLQRELPPWCVAWFLRR